jgi:hypothetical protein
MKRLTLSVLKNFNEWYDYNLSDEVLIIVLKELNDGYPVSDREILEWLEEYCY